MQGDAAESARAAAADRRDARDVGRGDQALPRADARRAAARCPCRLTPRARASRDAIVALERSCLDAEAALVERRWTDVDARVSSAGRADRTSSTRLFAAAPETAPANDAQGRAARARDPRVSRRSAARGCARITPSVATRLRSIGKVQRVLAQHRPRDATRGCSTCSTSAARQRLTRPRTASVVSNGSCRSTARGTRVVERHERRARRRAARSCAGDRSRRRVSHRAGAVVPLPRS